MKKIVVLGGGGFIGGHLAKRLKNDGNWVRVCDLKRHEYFTQDEFCNEFIVGDLRDPNVVSLVIDDSIDEVYQLAADMGGAGYIFTGDNDANVMHNSALINLNVVHECVKKKVGKVFYSSSACMYPEHNQLDPNNPNCEESSAYPANPDSEYGWEKLFSERLFLAFNRNYGLDVRIARFHNIFGPQGTWEGGKEKSPAAMCRKAAEVNDWDKIPNQVRPTYELEVWGDGQQTRSFLYVDECVEYIFYQLFKCILNMSFVNMIPNILIFFSIVFNNIHFCIFSKVHLFRRFLLLHRLLPQSCHRLLIRQLQPYHNGTDLIFSQ